MKATFRNKAIRRGLIGGAALLTLTPSFATETITYGYDARGRLVKVARSGSVNNGATECYTYDGSDNRQNVTVATSADCGGAGSGPGVSFSVNNVSVTEGGNLVFTVTKTGTATGTTTIDYATANGTATSGSDYTAASGTLSFTSAQTSKTVSVATIDDTVVESAETVFLNLSNPTGGATISDSQGVGTINDNDSTSTCSGVSFTIVSNAAVTEGTNSVFTITKSGTTSGSCSVNYGTANGTATSGSDYTAASGTLTFTSAQTSKTVSVTTLDDTTVESAETFTMSLSNPGSGATLGTPSSATATINDNDTAATPPSFTIADATATEGQELDFVVTKTGTTTGTFSVNYATADGSAVAPANYAATSGTLTFAPADTSKDILVPTTSTTQINGTRTMSVNLSGATGGATITDSQGIGSITDQCFASPTGSTADSSTSGSTDGLSAINDAPVTC